MEADVLAYLDQLHEQSRDKSNPKRDVARGQFYRVVFEEWPRISAILPVHDHSL